MLTLRSAAVPDRHLPVGPLLQTGNLPKKALASTVLPAPSNAVEPSPKTAASAPAPAFALRENANPHVRWPVDAGLSPSPASEVNSREGVVFVLDISGSMYEPYSGATRLIFARQILADAIGKLRENEPFALVVYAETAGRSGPLVPAGSATREAAIAFINQEYNYGGGTNLPAGMALVEQLHPGKVVLVTDGDLNMKASELLPKISHILGSSRRSPPLTIIGISPRAHTLDGELLQDLIDQQGGTYEVMQFGESQAPLSGGVSTAR